MSSMVKPLIAAFLTDALIAKGQAVKIGSSRTNVTPVASTTDLSIGIAQGATTVVGDEVEVAMPGGGGKGLANSTIAAGNFLGHNANAGLQKLANANDKIVAQALESAVAGDIFSVMVLSAQGVATQS